MKTVSLTVLLACVAVTFVQACDAKQVVTNKAAAMDAIKLEKSRQMQRNRDIEQARHAAAAAEDVKTIPRPMSATLQEEMQEQVLEKLQAAAESQRMKFKSIKEMNDRIAHRFRVHAEEKMRPPKKEPKPKPPPMNPPLTLQENEVNPEMQEQVLEKLQAAAESQRMKYKSTKEMNDRIAHRFRVHAEEKMRPPKKEPKPKPPPMNPPLTLQENEVNPVRVDTEEIIQNAKKAVERARNLPKSFKEWNKHMEQKMAARTHQQTAAKQNNNIRVASPATVNRYASPTIRNDLVKEIEVEGDMMKSHAPYHHVGRSQVINQAAHPRDPETYPMPLPQGRKAWENAVQARLEEMKANPHQWDEMRKRVEENVEMSGPLSPRRHPKPPGQYNY